MEQNIVQQLRDCAERFEDMERMQKDGSSLDYEQHEIIMKNALRELSYKIGSFFESKKPMKVSHKELRNQLQAWVRGIVKNFVGDEDIAGVSVSFVSAPPIDFQGKNWESDTITNILEIRVGLLRGVSTELLQKFKDTFKVDEVYATGHKYGAMKETIFNNEGIVDIAIVISRESFEAMVATDFPKLQVASVADEVIKIIEQPYGFVPYMKSDGTHGEFTLADATEALREELMSYNRVSNDRQLCPRFSEQYYAHIIRILFRGNDFIYLAL
jgi:hypothetical protein